MIQYESQYGLIETPPLYLHFDIHPLALQKDLMSLAKTVRNAALLLTTISASNLAVYLALRGPKPKTVQIIAHRGGAKLATENTEAAFRNADRLEADWIEFDVHRSSDGILVIMHDDTVNRMTNGVGYIKDMTWSQLYELRVTNGEHIMKFEEVVSLARELDIGILAELKSASYYPNIEEEALEIVRRYNYIEKTVFTSFEWDALERLKELESGVKVAALFGPTQWDVHKTRPASAEIIAPMAETLILNPWMIPQAHAEGRLVWVWFGVLDTPVVYRLMLELGVDGLIANDPGKARQLAYLAGQLATQQKENMT